MLAELLAEIARQGGYEDGSIPEPVIGLELFFDGNEDLGSIGCNLLRDAPPAQPTRPVRARCDRCRSPRQVAVHR
ncbi:MAG: hypothetical protein QOE61_3329 [Micromonosporaceae bacterium]|nr:hypothetical protein [Micromonosporaceae bacterium]